MIIAILTSLCITFALCNNSTGEITHSHTDVFNGTYTFQQSSRFGAAIDAVVKAAIARTGSELFGEGVGTRNETARVHPEDVRPISLTTVESFFRNGRIIRHGLFDYGTRGFVMAGFTTPLPFHAAFGIGEDSTLSCEHFSFQTTCRFADGTPMSRESVATVLEEGAQAPEWDGSVVVPVDVDLPIFSAAVQATIRTELRRLADTSMRSYFHIDPRCSGGDILPGYMSLALLSGEDTRGDSKECPASWDDRSFPLLVSQIVGNSDFTTIIPFNDIREMIHAVVGSLPAHQVGASTVASLFPQDIESGESEDTGEVQYYIRGEVVGDMTIDTPGAVTLPLVLSAVRASWGSDPDGIPLSVKEYMLHLDVYFRAEYSASTGWRVEMMMTCNGQSAMTGGEMTDVEESAVAMCTDAVIAPMWNRGLARFGIPAVIPPPGPPSVELTVNINDRLQCIVITNDKVPNHVVDMKAIEREGEETARRLIEEARLKLELERELEEQAGREYSTDL